MPLKGKYSFTLNMFLAVSALFTILAITDLPLSDVMFEVFSAMGTVGMTTGITRDLSSAARIIIMVLMFCGRVGSLSFALTFLQGKKTLRYIIRKKKYQ